MRKIYFVVLCAFIFAACSGNSAELPAFEARSIMPAATAEPIPTETQVPTQIPPTPTPVPPTPTSTPTPTHTYTPTNSPTPTPTPLHPLSIAFLRQGTYPPSDITIEQTLDPGPNYFRYIASYRSEGLQIFTYMTVPFGEKPESGWPVVVFNHGYIPPTQYRSTERYVAYVDAFAKRGYIVFRSDYRGHGDSGGNPRGAYGAPDYTIDVLNAVSALKNYADADPNRIGMWGHSMGGFITLRSMVTLADIRAGVIWGGVVGSYPDLFSRWRGPGTSDEDVPPQARRNREMVFAVYGDPEENPEFWDSISANTFLGDLSGPVQLHHGTADQSVPFAFSETLNEQIRAVGKPVEFYSYEGDNHNISIAFSLAMQRSIAFFDQHVKAYTGP